jgi:hypothetical protein
VKKLKMKLLNKKIKSLRVWWDGGGVLVGTPAFPLLNYPN